MHHTCRRHHQDIWWRVLLFLGDSVCGYKTSTSTYHTPHIILVYSHFFNMLLAGSKANFLLRLFGKRWVMLLTCDLSINIRKTFIMVIILGNWIWKKRESFRHIWIQAHRFTYGTRRLPTLFDLKRVMPNLATVLNKFTHCCFSFQSFLVLVYVMRVSQSVAALTKTCEFHPQ